MIKRLVKYASLFILLILMALVIQQRIRTDNDLSAMEEAGEAVETAHGTFRVHTQGAGTPVVFLSGLGTTGPFYDFKPLWQPLSDDHRIIVIERPGYGYNQTSSRDKGIASVVGGYREVLGTLDIETPVTIMAHSMAGLEAVYWAQNHPDEVSHIIGLDMTIAPVLLDVTGTPPRFSGAVQYAVGRLGLSRFMDEKSLESALPVLAYEGFEDEERNHIETLFHANMFNRNILRESRRLNENAETVAENAPARETAMLVFISNDLIDAHPEIKTIFADYFRDSETYESHVLDTGHYVHHEQSSQIIAMFRSFMAD